MLPFGMAAMLMCLLVAACQGDGTGSDLDRVRGSYSLRAINDTSLPYVTKELVIPLSVTGGVLRLEDSTYEIHTTTRNTQTGNTSTSVESGTYVVRDSSLVMTYWYSDGTRVSRLVVPRRNTITIQTNKDYRWTYRRD